MAGGNLDVADPCPAGVVVKFKVLAEFCAEDEEGNTDRCKGLAVSAPPEFPATPPPTTEAPAAAAM